MGAGGASSGTAGTLNIGSGNTFTRASTSAGATSPYWRAWWVFTITVTSRFSIDTFATTATDPAAADTILQLYSSPTSSPIATNDDAPDAPSGSPYLSHLTVILGPGTYYLSAGTFDASGNGITGYVVTLSGGSLPAPDESGWAVRNPGGPDSAHPGPLPANDYGGPGAVADGGHLYWTWTAPSDGVMTWDAELSQLIDDVGAFFTEITITDLTTSTLIAGDGPSVTAQVIGGHTYLIDANPVDSSHTGGRLALVIRASEFAPATSWTQAPDRLVTSYAPQDEFNDHGDPMTFVNTWPLASADATHRVRFGSWYQGYGWAGRMTYDQSSGGPPPWTPETTTGSLGAMDVPHAMFSHAVVEWNPFEGAFAFDGDGSGIWHGPPVLNPDPDSDRIGYRKDGGGGGSGLGRAAVAFSSDQEEFFPGETWLDHFMYGQCISLFDERREAGPFVGYTSAQLATFAGWGGGTDYYSFEQEASLPTVIDVALFTDAGGNELYDLGLVDWHVGVTRAAPADFSGTGTWGPYSRLNYDNHINGPEWWSGGPRTQPADMVGTMELLTTGEWSTVSAVALATSQEDDDVATFVAHGTSIWSIPEKTIVGLQIVALIPAAHDGSYDPGIIPPTRTTDGTTTIGKGVENLLAFPRITFRPTRYRYLPYPLISTFEPFLTGSITASIGGPRTRFFRS